MGLSFDPFGLTRNLNFIDDIDRAAKAAPKTLLELGWSGINEAKDQFDYFTSGERFLNDPLKLVRNQPLFGPAFLGAQALDKLNLDPFQKNKPGTSIKSTLEKSPILGDVLGGTFDQLASPLSIATLGGGSAALSGLKGLNPLLPMVARGGFKQRLAGELAAGFGANLGVKGANEALPEDTPGPLRTIATIGAGALGSGIGAAAVNKGFGRQIPRDPEMGVKPPSRRGYINEELEPWEVAQKLNKDKALISKLRSMQDQGIEIPDLVSSTLRNEYVQKYGTKPIRGVSKSTARYGEQAIPSPDQDLSYTLEKSLEQRGIQPEGPVSSLISPTPYRRPKPQSGKQGLFSTVNNLMRQAGATLDASAVGVQNLLGYGSINPKRQAQVLWTGFKSLWDPDALDDRIRQWDAEALAKNAPTQAQWLNGPNPLVDLRATPYVIPGTQGATSVLGKVPGIKHSNRMFNAMVSAQARAMADTLYDMAETGGAILTTGRVRGGGLANLEEIKNVANRTVGYTNKSLPYVLREGFFAPTFLKANIELLTKSIADGGLEGQVARRQLAKLAGVGASLVWLANESRGYETDFDPTSSNFMRIRNVGGTDINPLGYLDTLFRGMVLAAQDPIINPLIGAAHGEVVAPKFNADKLTYLARSKASPLLGLGIDLVRNQTFTGEDPRDPEQFVKYALPFSAREALDQPITATALGAFGVKASPLSPTEKLDQTLTDAGITKSDPEYDIKRKEYLAAHPEARTEKSGKFAEAQQVTDQIRGYQQANEEDTKSGIKKLADFRETRKELLLQQRAKLDQINPDYNKRDTQQSKWVDSYYNLFRLATDRRTGELIPKDFDNYLLEWLKENGDQAYDYVQRYSQAGKGEVEKQYIQDLRELDKLGYFDMPKYRNLRSGRSEDDLAQLRSQVEAERSADPKLQRLPFEVAARRVLTGLPQDVILDVIRIGHKAYQDPKFTKFQAQHKDLLQWFNPNATWNTYNKAKEIVRKAS